MSVLIKNATIIYPGHDLHGQKKDLLISGGIIEKIANRISDPKAKVITSDNLHVSPGWLDIGTNGGEPGFEHRETLETLAHCAASGGFTAIAMFPNTKPVIDNKSAVQYIINNTANFPVSFHPIGALSKNIDGQEITEMQDLHNSGAVAFSDGWQPVASSGLMMRALDYIKSMDSLVIHRPEETSLANGNQINEGIVSTALGLKGNPSISETMTLERDIQLTAYTGSKLLVYNVSAKESIPKLKSAAKNNVYASVSYLNLCSTDEALSDFDTNLKSVPPLRSASDKQALISGVNNATIQVITSNHFPLEEDAKKKEFYYAQAGNTGLQTCFSGMNTFAENLKLDEMIASLSINPRKILGLEEVSIKSGAAANLTLFDPSLEWTLDDKTNTSKSKNSPFWNQSLKGKVIGIVHNKKQHFNAY